MTEEGVERIVKSILLEYGLTGENPKKKYFCSGMGERMNKLEEVIQRAGNDGISKREVCRNYRFSAREFDMLWDYMRVAEAYEYDADGKLYYFNEDYYDE